jgi:opacity protein-like surface antigen
MKLNIALKSLLLVATAAFGLAASARADDSPPAAAAAAPASTANSLGLLGQTYAGLTYSYVHLDSSPVNADNYGFEYNQPLNTGFDAVFNYDWTQSGLVAGDRAHEQNLSAALRAFSPSQSWGKPYVEAGVGYDRLKFAGARDHSYNWIAGAGIEFQATNELTITPFIRYTRATGYADHDLAVYGVKANYWVTKQWAVTAGVDRNDSQDMSYRIGANVRF